MVWERAGLNNTCDVTWAHTVQQSRSTAGLFCGRAPIAVKDVTGACSCHWDGLYLCSDKRGI